jgi:hypothetical protein
MYVNRTVCPLFTTVSTNQTGQTPASVTSLTGLRGAGCKCGGSCAGCKSGLHGHHGMGLFDSMDFTTWGWQEWGIIGAGAYLVMSIIGDIGKGSRRVSGYRSKSRKRRQRRSELKQKMAELKSEYEAA